MELRVIAFGDGSLKAHIILGGKRYELIDDKAPKGFKPGDAVAYSGRRIMLEDLIKPKRKRRGA